MAEFPFWAAVRTVRDGLSGRAGLSAYRAGGGSIRNDTWFQMVAEARAAVAARGAELSRPLDRRPAAGEVVRWSTKGARGLIQQVEVMVRDVATGLVHPVPYSLKVTRSVTRQQAIDAALDHIESARPNYDDQVVLGAVYVGTLRMVPEGT